jgi:hypothetical protein
MLVVILRSSILVNLLVLPLATGLSMRGATLRVNGSYPLQDYALAIAAGDLNRDGKLDVVTGDNSKSVTIWLGDGKGALSFQARYSVGGMPRAIRLGDVNSDGNLDIVCTYWDSVAILLGNGDGTFRDGPRYPLALGVSTHAIADVNRDGKLDLIVPCAGIDSIAVLLGNGDGTFQAPRYVRTVPGSGWVEAADFNGDGIPDLVVASDSDSAVTGITRALVILLGAGDGSFPSSRRIDIPAGALTLAVGDIDGDRHTDIVAETSWTSILWGSGAGSFQLYEVPHDVPAGYPPFLADVDGDGRPDIITIANGAVTVRFNAGGRSFRPLVVFE